MAGDWIKLEHATLDKPEVLELAELLSMSHGDALLLCLRFWVWADEQSRDGRLIGRSSCRSSCRQLVDNNENEVRSSGVSKRALDALIRCPGFASALIHVGWLTEDDGVLVMVNFDRHNGKNAKKRTLKSSAQANWRKTAAESVDACVDAHVDGLVDHMRSTKASTREEKRSTKEAAPPPDPLWGEGLKVLTTANVPIETARRFIGRALKHWTADTVLDALEEAKGTADPKAYATKLLQAKPRKNGAVDYTRGAV